MRSPHASGLNQTLQHYSTEHNSIAETFNLSVWPLVAVLLVITLWVVMKELKKRTRKSRPYRRAEPGSLIFCFEKTLASLCHCCTHRFDCAFSLAPE
ncbi:YeeE/YedE thiosulfate transporter family protein [Escherichia coli]